MNRNLVKYPNSKNHYITEEGEVVKIVNAYYDDSVNKYIFTEGKARTRCSITKAKRLYKEITGSYDNEFLLRSELKMRDLSDKEIARFIQKTKKFRNNNSWKIEQSIKKNRLVLVVKTNLTFGAFYDKISELIGGI